MVESLHPKRERGQCGGVSLATFLSGFEINALECRQNLIC